MPKCLILFGKFLFRSAHRSATDGDMRTRTRQPGLRALRKIKGIEVDLSILICKLGS